MTLIKRLVTKKRIKILAAELCQLSFYITVEHQSSLYLIEKYYRVDNEINLLKDELIGKSRY